MNKKLGRLLQPGFRMYFAVMAIFVVVTALVGQYLLSGIEAAAMVILGGRYYLRQRNRHRALQAYVQTVTKSLEGKASGKLPFPSALIRLSDGMIEYCDDAFAAATGYRDSIDEQMIKDLLPNFNTEWLSSGKSQFPYDVNLKGKRYRIYGTAIRGDDRDGTLLGCLYLVDLTELYLVRDEYIRSRPVVAIILIDNYEELTKNLAEGSISKMNAAINDVITQWTENYHGLLRKLERNRYLFVFERRDLTDAIEGKFSLLEDIQKVVNPSGVAATISLGLGVEGADFEESYNFAALSLEMALSRGGSQAVVKNRMDFIFYGGHTQETGHRSRVRSRVTANSMLELIGQSSKIYIMGHKNADMDAIGAAVGVCCLCRKKGKKAYIVTDLEHNASEKLIAEIRQVPEYKDVFISGQEALLQCDSSSILVVVDTNRPDQVECRPLLESITKVCVIDHHRRAADYINPVVVNLHEPSASSASELVTELLQYGTEKDNVLPIESKSLLAGICLDTKSFNVRTSERTFEAAAFLRRLGADTVEVKKLMQNDIESTQARYRIIQSIRMYRDGIAIAALDETITRTLAAQAADEMLNISGILASFVLYPNGNEVVISARSIGKANVQVILEPLGGGGNAATAGAQVQSSTVEQALERLKESIDQYYDG